MSLDYPTLDALRTRHPAWRLLRSDHAPLVVSVLHRVFVAPNVRMMAAPLLAEALEDELYALREQLGDGAFPKHALEYLNDWASPEKGWLRKFYRQGSDEPQFDLTPAAEKAIAWLGTLTERSFVGTESRLLTLSELLRQMSEGSEPDQEKRLAELRARRAQMDEEIARVEAGDVRLLDDAALKDRFQQFIQMARDLLTDFREVEQNFRLLDRHVRERITLWEGSKGALIAEIMGERDAIADSDQGSSFRAFWDFLMSSRRQEELSERLERVLALPAIATMTPGARTRRIHYDWLEAGEHTQRTVAQLSQQLRRFLDDQAWLENRRIMDILRGIEAKALALRETPPAGAIVEIETASADIELPMERPLYVPTLRPIFANVALECGDADLDASALYAQIVVDRARLASHIRQCLQDRPHVTLAELVESRPLEHGLAELVAYLQMSAEGESFRAAVDESVSDTIEWLANNADGATTIKRARMPRVIFVR
ncbi:MAG TPA: DUF3375 domain-containing protein [Paraburkholderia sp.]|uniref:DUF3375 domain-containing protein n=1 Tax=Paraburkholderia sp. TaxID=1926495 RepID=UPI002C08C038|nr:DUF3375 domain-containing protein [Paraburkholderia sp.]HTR10322.1 DUF3375 domain-containing protein [Paraburkholderia sp.]